MAFDGVRKPQQRLGWRVHQDEFVPTLDELLQRRDSVATDRHNLDVERECLFGELPRRIVVLERDLGAGNAKIFWLDIEPRQGNEPLDLLFEVADGDQSGLGRGSGGG